MTDPRLVALLSEALERLPPQHVVWRAKLLARLAAAEQPAEAAALALPQWTRHVHLLGALVALLEGDFALAERAARASEAISVALGDARALWRLGVHHCMAAWTQTQPPDPERAGKVRPPVGRAAVVAWLSPIVVDSFVGNAGVAR